MADLGETFDPNDIPESERGDFTPIPAGWYEVQITESDVVDLKTGNGRALVLTFDVIGPTYANRKLWDRLNIRHTSQEAQAIAQRALADLFLATNTAPSRDSADLHFKPLMARVVIDPAKDGYDAKNVIKGYKAFPRAAAPVNAKANAPNREPTKAVRQPATRQAAPAQTAAQPKTRPWGARAAAPAIDDDDIPF